MRETGSLWWERPGRGKSTLAQTLAGLRVPTSGEVVAAGLPLRGWSEEAFRRKVAIALSEPAIFRGSASENVSLGRPGVGDDEVSELEWWTGAIPESCWPSVSVR